MRLITRKYGIVKIFQKLNMIQDKVSFLDSLLVITDDRHGTNLVVDERL